MTTDEQDLELEDDEPEEDPAEFAAARDELEKRCSASTIEVKEHVDFIGRKYLTVALPSGREKRLVHLADTEDIKGILSVPFERYVFLGEYHAICSYSDGVIEAGIRPLIRQMPTRFLFRRLLGRNVADGADESDNLAIEMRRESGGNGERISIGKLSEALIAVGEPRYRSFRVLSLRIEGLKVSQHDQALDILERIANSVFLQIDLALDLPLSLIRERRPTSRRSPRRERIELQFPTSEYDEAPMALYWYARSAMGMPLLQFLAFYQTIEFYFPTYSQAEARRKVRNILKDPSFRPDRDADLGRVLSTIKGSGGVGFGDERSQLRATLQECLDPTALREFLTADDQRKNFFSSKARSLTDIKIPINSLHADLRNDVAERIYDLRCKIVHTKVGHNEGEVALLLPFSKEAELLYFDIELIQYVAQQTLISGSSLLRF